MQLQFSWKVCKMHHKLNIYSPRRLTLVIILTTGLFFLLMLYHPLDPLVHPRYVGDEILYQSPSQRLLQSVIQPLKTPGEKKFIIHIWKHGDRMKRRFLRSYGSVEKNPYKNCRVRNCVLSTEDSLVNQSDAVLFHLHQTKGPHTLPTFHPRQQIWVFFTDESPFHTFLATKKFSMKDYNGLFNWSMTYRRDSDIPVPYGRVVKLTDEELARFQYLPNYAARKHKLIVILGSNCGSQNNRWAYVNELKKHITVDIYGRCGKYKCPGHFTQDCTPIGDYKFYLAFENSNCKEYITEKLWWNAYDKESIPVVMGAPKEDYVKLCPPNSFIHVEDFSSPVELVHYLKYLDTNDTAYNEYFSWKKNYKVLNEHGYFGSRSMHLCHICEALNTLEHNSKIYDDLESYWNPNSDCKPILRTAQQRRNSTKN